MAEFFQDYGIKILGTILMAVASYVAVVIKQLASKYLQDKTKQDVAKIVVQGVEQCYKALNGEEKLNKALENASELLTQKGIKVTDIELRMLLENAVGEFNNVFNKATEEETTEEIDTTLEK